jgi:hypothetical protein
MRELKPVKTHRKVEPTLGVKQAQRAAMEQNARRAYRKKIQRDKTALQTKVQRERLSKLKAMAEREKARQRAINPAWPHKPGWALQSARVTAAPKPVQVAEHVDKEPLPPPVAVMANGREPLVAEPTAPAPLPAPGATPAPQTAPPPSPTVLRQGPPPPFEKSPLMKAKPQLALTVKPGVEAPAAQVAERVPANTSGWMMVGYGVAALLGLRWLKVI